VAAVRPTEARTPNLDASVQQHRQVRGERRDRGRARLSVTYSVAGHDAPLTAESRRHAQARRNERWPMSTPVERGASQFKRQLL